jgi:hypothetical protein
LIYKTYQTRFPASEVKPHRCAAQLSIVGRNQVVQANSPSITLIAFVVITESNLARKVRPAARKLNENAHQMQPIRAGMGFV